MGPFLVYAVLFGFADVWTEFAVRRAAEGAALRLARPPCQQIFSDFQVAGGSDVGAAFDALRFVDDRGADICRKGVTVAFTQPGARVVHICGTQFKEWFAKDHAYTEIILIHEFLHSRGLGENPPSSNVITARVIARCGD